MVGYRQGGFAIHGPTVELPRLPKPPTKAQRIAGLIAEQISTEQLPPGAWLPGERQLAERYDVDRSTVRRSLRILEERGLILLQAGTGAQLREDRPLRRDSADITAREGQWRGFHVSVERAGRRPYTNTSVKDTPLDVETARWLGVPTGTEVLERARVQGVVGEPPVQISTTWVLPEVAARLPILRQVDTGPGGMLTRMEEIGYRLRFEDVVTCRLPNEREQETLQVDASQPVLDLWRRCYDQRGRILEVTRRIIVGGRHELVYHYDR